MPAHLSRPRDMQKLLPPLAVLASIALTVVAAQSYPGGYDWLGQSVSSLFQPTTLDGQENPARPLAVAAVVAFCLGMAAVFATIAATGPTRFHRKAVQIGGIGAMVYAALLVTPMHDVLVGMALLFFLTATLTLVHGLYLQRRLGLLALGLASLALVVGNAAMYYGDLLYGFLPAVQKASLALWVTWLFALYFSPTAPRACERKA